MEGENPTGNSLRNLGRANGDRLLAALAWLWLLSVIILLVQRDRPFVQHHARQGTLLFLASILVWVLLTLLTPLLGPLAWILQWLFQLTVFVLVVVGFLQALAGKLWSVPLLGAYAPRLQL